MAIFDGKQMEYDGTPGFKPWDFGVFVACFQSHLRMGENQWLMWCPPSYVCWFINPIIYRWIYHKHP